LILRVSLIGNKTCCLDFIPGLPRSLLLKVRYRLLSITAQLCRTPLRSSPSWTNDRPLTPQDPQQAKEALEWEEYLHEEIGVPLRQWFYYYMLPDRNRALRFMLNGAPWYGLPLFTLIYPKIRTAMKQRMNIHAETAKQSEQRLLAALERLDGALQESRFLVGNCFSRADLTACALLSPYCAPGKSDQEVSFAFPEQVCALRDQHKTRDFFNWVLDIYKGHRHSLP
jgi:glutathione S-transferase